MRRHLNSYSAKDENLIWLPHSSPSSSIFQTIKVHKRSMKKSISRKQKRPFPVFYLKINFHTCISDQIHLKKIRRKEISPNRVRKFYEMEFTSFDWIDCLNWIAVIPPSCHFYMSFFHGANSIVWMHNNRLRWFFTAIRAYTYGCVSVCNVVLLIKRLSARPLDDVIMFVGLIDRPG